MRVSMEFLNGLIEYPKPYIYIHLNISGENVSEKQVPPAKQYRAAVLLNRFADTIFKAREKTLDQVCIGNF